MGCGGLHPRRLALRKAAVSCSGMRKSFVWVDEHSLDSIFQITHAVWSDPTQDNKFRVVVESPPLVQASAPQAIEPQGLLCPFSWFRCVEGQWRRTSVDSMARNLSSGSRRHRMRCLSFFCVTRRSRRCVSSVQRISRRGFLGSRPVRNLVSSLSFHCLSSVLVSLCSFPFVLLHVTLCLYVSFHFLRPCSSLSAFAVSLLSCCLRFVLRCPFC